MTSFEAGKAINPIGRFPVLQERPFVRYAVAALLSVAALSVRIALDDVLPPGYPFVTFLPVVIVAAFLFGCRTGIFATLLCGVFAGYFLLGQSGLDRAAVVPLGFYAAISALAIVLIHALQVTNARLRSAREHGRLLADESDRLTARSEMLFQELQHRVGNNLQMVAAVLSLQLRSLDEPKARRAITDAVARVQVIGSIQRRLYRNNGELVPLDEFIREVSEQLMRSRLRPGIAYTIDTSSGLVLTPYGAVPMALILAEAVANAIEHGFAEGDSGEIQVLLELRDDCVILEVHDNGAGLPNGFDYSQADSLGLRVSRVLSRQLGAEYSLENALPGATMRLTIPRERLVQSVSSTLTH